ncbi:hypothetical protein OAF37_03545, partial [Rubripirellula sp.]|nr:hypothetical protein [Rubripirellula sp.]
MAITNLLQSRGFRSIEQFDKSGCSGGSVHLGKTIVELKRAVININAFQLLDRRLELAMSRH